MGDATSKMRNEIARTRMRKASKREPRLKKDPFRGAECQLDRIGESFVPSLGTTLSHMEEFTKSEARRLGIRLGRAPAPKPMYPGVPGLATTLEDIGTFIEAEQKRLRRR
jgi:hypothetical protein